MLRFAVQSISTDCVTEITPAMTKKKRGELVGFLDASERKVSSDQCNLPPPGPAQ